MHTYNNNNTFSTFPGSILLFCHLGKDTYTQLHSLSDLEIIGLIPCIVHGGIQTVMHVRLKQVLITEWVFQCFTGCLQLHGLKFIHNLQENTLFSAFFQPKDPNFYMIFQPFLPLEILSVQISEQYFAYAPCDKGTLMSTGTNMQILRQTYRQTGRQTDRQMDR